MNSYIKSHWGVPLKGRFTDNGSETLCIILPGIGYLLDRSYLDYTQKIADHELHMDVYEMEYGFQITRADFNPSSEFDLLAKETIAAISNAVQKSYKRYIIIGKSIGTCLQILLNKELAIYNVPITNVFISPIDKTADMGIAPGSLVLTGLSDPLLSHDSLLKIGQIPHVKLITAEGANHSLDISGDISKTIDLLKENLMHIKGYIS